MRTHIWYAPNGSMAAPPISVTIEAAPGATEAVIDAMRKAGHEVTVGKSVREPAPLELRLEGGKRVFVMRNGPHHKEN